MKMIRQTLYRTICLPFYQQHAGLFVFAFFLLFGIQPGAAEMLKFHYAVILSILDSPVFFSLAIFAWAIYCLKTVLFFRACLKKEAYDFLYLLLGIPLPARLKQLALVILLLQAPLLTYVFLILIISVSVSQTDSGLLVMAAMMSLSAFSLLACSRLLCKGKDNQRISKALRFPVKPGLAAILIRFVFRKQLITLIILKMVSFLTLYFFSRTDAQVFEGRMLWLLFITLLAGHGVIIFRNVHFMETELTLYRNLPISRMSTFLSLAVVYAFLLIPEVWALKGVWLIQGHGVDFLCLALTGPAFLLLIHSLMYSEDLNMPEFLPVLFGLWVVFIFLSLSSLRWLPAAVAAVFSMIIFRMSYYRYEKKPGGASSEGERIN